MTTVKLDVVRTGEIAMPHAYAFRGDGNLLSRLRSPTLRCPCLAYVIRHADGGVTLVDTGFHRDAASDLRKDFGLPMSVLFRGLETAPTPFDQQLRELAIEPDAVERVVMTHLHVDHTSGMRLLPNATFACSRDEWVAARQRFAARHGYVAHHLPSRSRMSLLDFRNDGEPEGPFAQTIDLLGDGSVRLVSTPGHTRGHTSVLLRVEDGRPVLLVGDAAYTLRNIREQVLPLLTAGDSASRRSLRELKAFQDQNPDAVLVPSHDPDAWRQLPSLQVA